MKQEQIDYPYNLLNLLLAALVPAGQLISTESTTTLMEYDTNGVKYSILTQVIVGNPVTQLAIATPRYRYDNNSQPTWTRTHNPITSILEFNTILSHSASSSASKSNGSASWKFYDNRCSRGSQYSITIVNIITAKKRTCSFTKSGPSVLF